MTTQEQESDILIDEDELTKRHKQERKELHSKIQSLKKSVPKGDKKKKKEVTEEIALLEKELEDRIARELNELKSNDETPTIEDKDCENIIENNTPKDESGDNTDEPQSNINTRLSRAQRRRNKKANEERDREKRVTEQMEQNKRGSRAIEMNQIKEKLKTMNLKLHTIDADGNCLYCAVIHQLEMIRDEHYEVSELRKITAQFIRDHKEDFLPFMYNELDDNAVVSEEHFESYCNEVATTKLWGGQLELRALSNYFKCPIKIIQANGPPTLQGESFAGPELIITYHRHLYRLGEHYNSTVPDASSRSSL